jgi:hypothetical protein
MASSCQTKTLEMTLATLIKGLENLTLKMSHGRLI